MRLADLTPGDIVRHPSHQTGALTDMREGRSSLPALVLDIGPYTEVRFGCGRSVARLERGPARVVIALPKPRWLRFDEEEPIEWEPRVVNPARLMAEEEWQAKHFAFEELRARDEHHEAEGQRLKDAARERLLTLLGLGGVDGYLRINRWERKGKTEVELTLRTDDLRKLLGADELDAIVADYLAWNETPKPSSCS